MTERSRTAGGWTVWAATRGHGKSAPRYAPPSAPRAARRLASALALALIFAVAAPAAASNEEAPQALLGRVWCLDVVIGTFEAPDALGLTRQTILDATEVALRARLPDLPIQDTCPAAMRLIVVLANSSPTVFYGVADLTVLRRAIVVETGDFSRAEAWRTTFVLHGPAEAARDHVVHVLETMIDRFAREREASQAR